MVYCISCGKGNVPAPTPYTSCRPTSTYLPLPTLARCRCCRATITISETNFTGATAVSFGDATATSFNVVYVEVCMAIGNESIAVKRYRSFERASYPKRGTIWYLPLNAQPLAFVAARENML